MSTTTLTQATNNHNNTNMSSASAHELSEAQRQRSAELSTLLWLDYMNADGAAAQTLFQAEQEQMVDYKDSKQGSLAPSRPPHRRQLSQEEEKHLAGWNQFLWLEYMNADGAAAQQILQAEREDIAEYQREWEKVAQDQVSSLSKESGVRVQLKGKAVEAAV